MSVINNSLQNTINDILTKKIVPTKIYRDKIGELFTIEVETIDPTVFHSILYKKEDQRDKDFCEFDNQAFDKLTFNPLLFNKYNLEVSD